jgi:hypothetical protein
MLVAMNNEPPRSKLRGILHQSGGDRRALGDMSQSNTVNRRIILNYRPVGALTAEKNKFGALYAI